MDQLKVILAHLKKQHFWVLASLALLLSLLGWYMATNRLVDEYATNKGKIENEFNELRQIVSQTNHPNEKFEAGTNVLTANLTKDVRLAWTRVYKDQKAKVLKWPAALGNDFLQWVEAAGPNDEIPIDYRDRYLNYVKEEFPRLLQIVDARPFWDREDDDGAGPRGDRRPMLEPVRSGRRNRPVPPKKDYKVLWESKNQQEIDESLDFTEGIPDSTTVRFCQENLWVYHALLNAIALVNEGATGNHNAKIKEIVSLNIGQSASGIMMESLTSGRIVGNFEAGGEGMDMGGPGMPGPGMGGPAMPGGPAGGGLDGLSPDGLGHRGPILDDKRYVDEKGTPLPSGTPGPAEFKRMPIVMQLVMDQREIARLLVALADSPLPVEIRQLRINTKMAGVKREPHRQFGYGSEGAGKRGDRGLGASMARNPGLDESLQYPYDLAVEVVGIIYIFNPPDKALNIAGGMPAEDALPEDALPEDALPEDALPEDALPEDGAAAVSPASESEPTEPEADPSEAAEPGTVEPEAAEPGAGAEAEPAGVPGGKAAAGEVDPPNPGERPSSEPATEAAGGAEPPPAGFESGEAVDDAPKPE